MALTEEPILIKRLNVIPALVAVLAFWSTGCSLKKVAVNVVGNALAEGSSGYASDDDPELVAQASAFGLKTVESLLAESPRHKGLLFAATSGFTQYGYAFVQQEADFVEARDLTRATELRTRAGRLYRRALRYGLRGLDLVVPDFEARLRRDRVAALAPLRREHVPLLYWTGLAWFAAINVAKTDSELSADQALAEALLHRARDLDESWDYGSLHEFYVTWEGRGEAVGGSFARSRQHFEQALAFNKGQRASTYVALAEGTLVAQQNRKEFEERLQQALAVDIDAVPELRLSNLIYQKRARWLLARADELFIE